MKEYAAYIQLIAEHLDGFVWLVDPLAHTICYVSPASQMLFGMPGAHLYDDPVTFFTLVHPDDRARVQHRFAWEQPRPLEEKFRLVHPDGSIRHVWVKEQPIQLADTTLCWLGMAKDITPLESTLTHQTQPASIDTLTGLANSHWLYTQGQTLFTSHSLATVSHAILSLDLGRLRTVNETFGYHVGDELLVQVAVRLRNFTETQAVPVRLGGDTFAIILPRSTPTEAVTYAYALLNHLCQPFELHGQHIYLGGSIGIAVSREGNGTLPILLKYADSARYQAKVHGGGVHLYDPNGQVAPETPLHMVTSVQPRTILIVEDSISFRAIYRRYLNQTASSPYHYLEAETGAQGLALCRTNHIDCVILDYLLPDMDGEAFLQALKNHRGILPIAVVVITGAGNESVAVTMIQQGAMNYLVKDHLNAENLQQAVGHAIERHTLLCQVEEQNTALMQSAERFRTSLDTMLDCFGIYTATRDHYGRIVDFRIEYVNQAACAHQQRSYEEQVGRHLCDLFPAFCTSDLFAAFCRVVDTGQPLIRESVIGETPNHHSEVQQVYDMRAVKLGDGFALAWRDISERKHSESERNRLLRDEHIARRTAERAVERMARLQTVTAALSAGISFAQVAEVIVDQGIAALEGQAGFVALLSNDGTHLDISGSHGYSPQVLHAWQQLTLTVPTPMSVAVQMGQPIWVESRERCIQEYPQVSQIDLDNHAWAALPLLIDEQSVGGLSLSFATARSFTPEDRAYMLTLAQQCAQALARARLYEREQQARSEAEAAVEVRDQVFSMISHDLKNPLSVIQGYVGLVKRMVAALDIPQRDQLMRRLLRIDAAVAQILAQTHELLDVARLRAGKDLPLDYQALDLVALTQQAAAATQALTESHSIRVETNLAALPMVGDVRRLERVMSNLLMNAINYSPQGGPIVVTLMREDHADPSWAVITVQDEGMGIPAKDLPFIFEAFKRGSNVAERISGTGLGLASARQIVEQHSGTITVNSIEGKGTTFTIRLPLLEAPYDLERSD